MPKQKIPVVTWTKIGEDDFVFRFRDYCLRVEQMTTKYWWWCVYYKDDCAGFNDVTAKSVLEAKLLAELCFIRHWSQH